MLNLPGRSLPIHRKGNTIEMTSETATVSRPRSEACFERASRVLIGGVNSPVRAFGSVGGTPVFVDRADGPHIFDVDGHRYIDLVGSWGPAIVGHAHREVVRAVQETAAKGLSFGACCPSEAELGELVVGALPSVEMVRFVNSGTEATMSAVRLARAATGRSCVVKFLGCYHGHVDSLLAGNMGFVPPDPGFLEGLRSLCDENGSLLIFDEVMTGFRVAWGGYQVLSGIRPDLTCLGKVIGGGMPVASYGGPRALMEQVSPLGPVYQAGTLSGNPIGMACGIATLKLCAAAGFYEHLGEQTARLAEGMRSTAAEEGVAVQTGATGGMFGMAFSDRPVINYDDAAACDHELFKRFFHAMLDRGIWLPPSGYEAMFVSAAHDDSIIDEILAAARDSFKAIQP